MYGLFFIALLAGITLEGESAQKLVSEKPSVSPVSPKTVTSASNITTKEYQFKEVGIKLEIKPQISGENSIRLDISQESSDSD